MWLTDGVARVGCNRLASFEDFSPAQIAEQDKKMDLQTLVDDAPKLHDHEGQLVLWGLPRPVLEFIAAQVSEKSSTLETGAGLSTLLFALKGARHTCVTPSQQEVDRITAYGERRGISLERVDFRVGLSTDVLPKIGPRELDLALIDGGHGFPTVFMDWYYIASWLRVGGTLIIDDLQIWTGHILKEFLLAEREWKLTELFANKTAIFLKEKECCPWNDFGGQPYVLKQSALLNVSEPKFRKGMRLLKQGRFLTLAKKLAMRDHPAKWS
jgi:methyltransferase family protein